MVAEKKHQSYYLLFDFADFYKNNFNQKFLLIIIFIFRFRLISKINNIYLKKVYSEEITIQYILIKHSYDKEESYITIIYYTLIHIDTQSRIFSNKINKIISRL